MAEEVQGLEAPQVLQDNLASTTNAPGAGERSAPLMARPEWVPEKFFKDGVIDNKGMAMSYAELEKKQATASAPVEAPAVPAPAAADVTPVTAPIVVPGVAPERVTAFSSEIQKEGKLSAASYTELHALGYSKETVDTFVKGMSQDAVIAQAVGEAQVAQSEITSILDGVGGKAKFDQMITWAHASMSAPDQAAYNAAVGSKDPAKVRMAVNGLQAEFTKVHGNAPQYLPVGANGRPAGNDAVQPFASEDEVARVMGTRLYKTDQAERDRVAKRLANSPNLFLNAKDYSKTER